MKLYAAAAVLLTLSASYARAADLPVKARPAPMPEAFSWTGFYIGANAGYAWTDTTQVTHTPDGTVAFATTVGGINGGTPMTPIYFNNSGALAGLQAGYNFQAGRNFVAGIEADFQWSDIAGSGTSVPFLLVGNPSNTQAWQSIRWFGTVRGRLGWLATSNLLLYGTAGFAYGSVRNNVVLNAPFFTNLVSVAGTSFLCDPGPKCFVGASSRTATGWTAGAGAEYAVSRNVTLKAEYLYVSLDGATTTATALLPQPGQTGPRSTFASAFSGPNFQLVRLGANWRF